MSPEIWAPPPREQFVRPSELSPERQAKARRYRAEFRALLERYPREGEKLGAEMGKAFVRLYQDSLGISTPDQLSQEHQAVRQTMGEKMGGKFLAGFLAEIAAAEIFTTLRLETYYPLLSQDQKESPRRNEEAAGIDWWIYLRDRNTPDGLALAVQVKTIPLKEGVKNQVLYPLRRSEDLIAVTDALVTPEKLDVSPRDLEERQGEIIDHLQKVEKVLEMQKIYANCLPILMVLPSPFSEGARFNVLTPKPEPALLEDVRKSLEDNRLMTRSEEFEFA